MPSPNALLLPVQILALAVGLQVIFLVALFWRGIFGKPQLGGMRPRWLYIPLLGGTAFGLWYALAQSDLVFGLAQAVALFLGVCVLRSPRLEEAPPAAAKAAKSAKGPAKTPKGGAR
jgi:hypothetical protein